MGADLPTLTRQVEKEVQMMNPSQDPQKLLETIARAALSIPQYDLEARRFVKSLSEFIGDSLKIYPMSKVLAGLYVVLGALADEFSENSH